MAAFALPLDRAEASVLEARQLAQSTKVAVPARGGDHRAGGIDPGTGHQPLVDRLLEGEDRPAEVAHGGEAAHQRAFGLGRGGEMDIADLARLKDGDRQRREHRVPVGVDQSRHQHASAAVDHLRALRRRRVVVGDGRDGVSLDPQAHTVAQHRTGAVEQPAIGEHDRCRHRGLSFGPLRQAEPREQSDGRDRAGHEPPPCQIEADLAGDGMELGAVAEAADMAGILGQGRAVNHLLLRGAQVTLAPRRQHVAAARQSLRRA